MAISEYIADTMGAVEAPPSLSRTVRDLRAPVGVPQVPGDLVDQLETFVTRWVHGAADDGAAWDAITVARIVLSAAEADLSDQEDAQVIAGPWPTEAARERDCPCFGCGYPTWTDTGVCVVCQEAVLRDGETMADAGRRVRSGDLTQLERDRLGGRA